MMGNVDIFSHSEVGILHIIFQSYHPGTFMPIAMQNPHSLFIVAMY